MKRFLAFLISLAVFLFVFSSRLPRLYGVEYPRTSIITRETDLDPALSARFAEKRPEMVLLGNSMLGEGIDDEAFDALVPERVLKLGLNGAASAVWYLVIKNFVCVQDPPPEVVVLFFRDTFLTWPKFRVDGRYREVVDRHAGPEEATLDRLAYLEGMSSFVYYLNTRFVAWGERERVRDDLVGLAKFPAPYALAGADSLAVEEAISRTFADSNMNQELLTAAQLAAEKGGGEAQYLDFAANLGRSFLPAMLDRLEERGIKTVMVRVKKRRDLDPGAAGEALEAYVLDLESYLDSRGVGFLDYTHEESLRLEHFGEGDHLNEQGREIFTRMFAEDLKALRAGEDRR